MTTVTINNEKNGIEIRFDSKPEKSVLSTLREHGFRWSKYQKMWYAKLTDDRLAIANSMKDVECAVNTKSVKQNNDIMDLWELTRTDNIENHYAKEKLTITKDIASKIRGHLRGRFPMCKWSVTSSYSSVYVELKASPWSKDSDMVDAIMKYAKKFRESYNYNNSDIMTDYFDVNFYGSCQIDYDYNETGEADVDVEIRKLFEQRQAEAEERERIEMELKVAAYREEEEKRRKEYEERERIRNINHEIVEENVKVSEDADYFIKNLKERGRKNDSVDSYLTDMEYDTEEENELYNKWKRCDCKISTEVRMDKEIYALFSNMLLDEWSFLEGKGGFDTDDNRINDMGDYNRMSAEERKTVHWYNIDCIAIFVEKELMMVIDPEGYNYARYCFFPDEETYATCLNETDQVLSDERKKQNKEYAETITDASTEIIMANEMIQTWDNSDYEEYRTLMIDWLENHKDIPFTMEVIREIDIPILKTKMLGIYDFYNGVQGQFRRAKLTENQKITIFKIGELGGITPDHITFKSYEPKKYAQHDDAVRMVFRPENRRKDYYRFLYKDMIIFDGFVDIPENLFWEITRTPFGTTKKSKYTMFDNRMYDDVLDYFAEKGIKPIINTYKVA